MIVIFMHFKIVFYYFSHDSVFSIFFKDCKHVMCQIKYERECKMNYIPGVLLFLYHYR